MWLIPYPVSPSDSIQPLRYDLPAKYLKCNYTAWLKWIRLPGSEWASFLEQVKARTSRLVAPLVFGMPTRELQKHQRFFYRMKFPYLNLYKTIDRRLVFITYTHIKRMNTKFPVLLIWRKKKDKIQYNWITWVGECVCVHGKEVWSRSGPITRVIRNPKRKNQ